MSTAHPRLEIISESPKSSHTVEMGTNDLELIFGTPTSPKNTKNSNLNHTENHHGKPHHNGNHTSEAERTSQPLLEPDREKQKPPLAGPEIDDLDDEVAAHNNNKHFPGIDDGLLEPIDNKPDIIDVGDESHDEDGNLGPHEGDDSHTEDGKWPWPSGDEPDGDYDHTHGLTPRFGLDDRPISPIPSAIDVNTYQQKKNLAQGMMDLALLSANANQLRYVLESASTHPYYYSSLVFISLSIIFQIAVGVGLIMNSRYDVNDKKEICKADKINNFTVLGIFLITIVNVFITSFSVATNTIATASTTVPAG